MPRYFFRVYHDRAEFDFVGEELPDKHAAWHQATMTAGQTLQSLDGTLQPDREWRMEVMDEFENPLYVLHINAENPIINGRRQPSRGGTSRINREVHVRNL